MTPIGKAGVIESAAPSRPMAGNILVSTIHRPFSYLHDASDFPKEIEVWDRTGKVGSQGGQPAAGRSRANQWRDHRSAPPSSGRPQ